MPPTSHRLLRSRSRRRRSCTWVSSTTRTAWTAPAAGPRPLRRRGGVWGSARGGGSAGVGASGRHPCPPCTPRSPRFGDPPVIFDIGADAFERIVTDELDLLPDEMVDGLDNVV